MNGDLFGDEIVNTTARRPTLSRKQRAVVEYLKVNPEITLAQAVALIGRDIYANQNHHVGALLANMVKRGLIERVKPGVFKLP